MGNTIGHIGKIQDSVLGVERYSKSCKCILKPAFVFSGQRTAEQITAAEVAGNGTVSATDASRIAGKAVAPSIVFAVEQ